jgi:hypothetical protein
MSEVKSVKLTKDGKPKKTGEQGKKNLEKARKASAKTHAIVQKALAKGLISAEYSETESESDIDDYATKPLSPKVKDTKKLSNTEKLQTEESDEEVIVEPKVVKKKKRVVVSDSESDTDTEMDKIWIKKLSKREKKIQQLQDELKEKEASKGVNQRILRDLAFRKRSEMATKF